MAGVGFLSLAIIVCWYIASLSVKVTFTNTALGPNAVTDRTFITLGFKRLLQMGLLLRLGPNVIIDGTFITWVQLLHLFPLHPSTPIKVEEMISIMGTTLLG